MSDRPNALTTAEVDDLLKVPCLFGLRAQGHIPTVEAMLRDGRTWAEIGRAIGWDAMTARRFYEIESARSADRTAERGETLGSLASSLGREHDASTVADKDS